VVVAPQQLPRHLRLHIPHTHTHIPHIPHTRTYRTYRTRTRCRREQEMRDEGERG
jgi:hypothetical protein